MSDSQSSNLRLALGPGLLMAGAAVGVSHLVQATRAGAEYGLTLLGLVLLACLLKYPFIEFGPRYAAATGESLIAGYRRLGNWALGLFTLITLGTMLIIQASVTLVTAGLAGLVFGLTVSVSQIAVGVILACMVVLAIGRFRGLDLVMKFIMLVLALSTLAAVVLALAAGTPAPVAEPTGRTLLWSGASLVFLLALLGWMPIPLDVAAWHSLWTLERSRQTGQKPSVWHAVLDCRIGYIGATVLAAAFLLLGALIMYPAGTAFPDSAVAFSGALVDLYAAALGDWSRPLIAVAALTTMFSTTLAVTDAYPRVLRALIEIGQQSDGSEPATGAAAERMHRSRYISGLLLVTIGALIIIHYFGHRFTALVDFATTVSFLAAPLLAWLNLRLMGSAHMPSAHRPGPMLTVMAWTGLAFLVAFSLIWIGWRLFG